MVGILGSLGAGAVGGTTVAIIIKAFDQFTGVFNKANKGLLLLGGAITAVGVAGAGAIGGLLRFSGEMERTKISFETLLGSVEAADLQIRRTFAFAKRTPFDIRGVFEAEKRLLAYGSTQEGVLKDLRVLGDIASVVGVEKLPQLVLAFGQVRAKTVLAGQELRQFTETGIPIVKELAKVTGFAIEEIVDQTKDLGITFDQVLEALTNMTSKGGIAFNAMERQSQTLFGQLQNAADSFTELAIIMGNVFLPVAKKLAEKMAVLSELLAEHPTLAKFAAVMLAIATATALVVGPIIIIIGLLPFLIAGFAALSAASLPITLSVLAIAAGIALLIAGIVALILWWDNLGKKTKIVLGILFPMVTLPIAIIKNWEKFKIGMAEIWNSIVGFFGTGVNKIISFLNKLISGFNKIARRLGGKTIGKISSLDISGALFDVKAMKEALKTQDKVTESISEMTEEQKRNANLVKRLKGFKLITSTGDIFGPAGTGALKSSDFESDLAFRLAVKEREGRITAKGQVISINIENIIGLNPEEISRALKEELSTKISI